MVASNGSHSTLPLDSRQKLLKIVKGVMASRIIILTLLLTITFFFQVFEKKLFFFPLINHFY